MAKVTVSFKVPWYANVYLNSVIMFAKFFNLQPDEEKVTKKFISMIKFEVNK